MTTITLVGYADNSFSLLLCRHSTSSSKSMVRHFYAISRHALWLAALFQFWCAWTSGLFAHPPLLFRHAPPDPTIESNYSKTVNLDDMVTVLVRSPSLFSCILSFHHKKPSHTIALERCVALRRISLTQQV